MLDAPRELDALAWLPLREDPPNADELRELDDGTLRLPT